MANDLSYLDSAATLSGLYALAGGLAEKTYEVSKTYDSFQQIIPKAFSLECLCNSRLIKASKWVGMGTLVYNSLRATQRLLSNSSQDRPADYLLLAGAILGVGAMVASSSPARFAARRLVAIGTFVDFSDLIHTFGNWQDGQVRWHQLLIQAGLTLVFGLNTGKKPHTTTSDAPPVGDNLPASSPLDTAAATLCPSHAVQPGSVLQMSPEIRVQSPILDRSAGLHTGHMPGKIEIRNVNFFYGGYQALHDITLSIRDREVTALIGPSGCGKSTLLRCLNRLNETMPDTGLSGKIYIDGENIHAGDAVLLRRRIGMIFQRPNPFPTMSIFDNVAAGLHLNGNCDHRLIQGRVIESLQQVALWNEVKDRLHHSGVNLSGGQQQRLCIARALAIRPEVLLMDEPCSALDPISTARIEALIRELCARYTIIIVTHNMQQAARVSHRTAFLYMGRLIEFGETGSIFTRPSERQTEDYITGKFG